ncbi:MAG: radical SAM protein [Desulfobacterales bacterium]|jgi:radical SAM superfamily enzyme YgiQ (UPF0313 family)|nr:radical SAM protein [Desulfobacterales bacterium]
MTKTDAPHILLINPWIHDFAAYDAWASPLGLLTLAGILREHGCRVSYVDCLDRFHPRAPRPAREAPFGCGPFLKTRLPKPAPLRDVPRHFSRYGIDPGWLREDLRTRPAPDLVLVTSGMTYWYTGVQETIGLIREIHPNAPVVLGGVYATLCTAHARRVSGADEVIAGQAEESILGLVARYTGCRAAPRHAPDDIDAYPYPALELQRRIAFLPLLTRRGCPFACAYCAANLMDSRRLRRSPAAVAAELRYWHRRHGLADVALYDDAFLSDVPGHALPVLEAIVRADLPLRFHTPNAVHVRGITPETAGLMFRAGFRTLRLGLETTDRAQHRQLDRKVTAAEFAAAARTLIQAGFNRDQVGAYLLVGLPGQPAAEVLRSIAAVKQAGVRPLLAYYSPIPGTSLWPQAVAASRYDLTAEPLCANNSVFPCRREAFSWTWIAELKRHIASG